MTYSIATRSPGRASLRTGGGVPFKQMKACRKQSRQGNISFVYLIICLLITVMAIFSLNVGHLTHQKLQMQNATDSAAISSATWMTRGMNSVTATNHSMGEMTGMVIIHHSWGGYALDQNRLANASDYPGWDTANDGRIPPERRDIADRDLDRSSRAARGLQARTPAYETVRQKQGVLAAYTLLDGKIRLKGWLSKVYWTKVAAKLMQLSFIPVVREAGIALELSADAFEVFIFKEYLFLKAMHLVAKGLQGPKIVLRDLMLPAARDYADRVVDTFPKLAEEAAKEVGKKMNVEVELFPRKLKLPVMKDPHRYAISPINSPNKIPASSPAPPNPTGPATNMRDQAVKTSQLARSTFPWVTYHRPPIIRLLGSWAPLSRAAKSYKHWTDGCSKMLLDEFQRPGRDLGLYVLIDSTAPDKGYEPWTKDPQLFDSRFSLQAFGYREKPKLVGTEKFFQQKHTDGRVTVAQASIYNGNPQLPHIYHIDLTRKRIVGEKQAEVGWDTLNWTDGFRATELVAKDGDGGASSEQPRISVNWQSKLVPISPDFFEAARKKLPSKFRQICERVVIRYPELFTH